MTYRLPPDYIGRVTVTSSAWAQPPRRVDSIVIGAGFSGLYASHRLRGSHVGHIFSRRIQAVTETFLSSALTG
jgi:hypothetical protein